MGVSEQRGESIGADRTDRHATEVGLVTNGMRGPRGQSSRPTRQGPLVSGIVAAETTRRRDAQVALTCAVMGIALMLAYSAGRVRAQGPAVDVAYVEAVSGRAVASSQGTTAGLDVLDPLDDGTRLDLETNAVLRLCHYRTHHLFTLKGPLRASISAAGVVAEDGTAVGAAGEACAAPVVSTFQGGFALRGLMSATLVALRPRIRIINRGAEPIQQAALWDLGLQTEVAMFGRTMAQPQLTDGQRYSLVVDFTNGSQWKATFQASSATETSTVIVVLR
jgi:hypothetical protein